MRVCVCVCVCVRVRVCVRVCACVFVSFRRGYCKSASGLEDGALSNFLRILQGLQLFRRVTGVTTTGSWLDGSIVKSILQAIYGSSKRFAVGRTTGPKIWSMTTLFYSTSSQLFHKAVLILFGDRSSSIDFQLHRLKTEVALHAKIRAETPAAPLSQRGAPLPMQYRVWWGAWHLTTQQNRSLLQLLL